MPILLSSTSSFWLDFLHFHVAATLAPLYDMETLGVIKTAEAGGDEKVDRDAAGVGGVLWMDEDGVSICDKSLHQLFAEPG